MHDIVYFDTTDQFVACVWDDSPVWLEEELRAQMPYKNVDRRRDAQHADTWSMSFLFSF